MPRPLLSQITSVLALVTLSARFLSGAEPVKESPTELASQSAKAWDIAWQRFFNPKTELFYDYLSSYEPGKELAHLPTEAEVKRQYPNPCGYSTGMEDCMILAGAMLSVLSDRHEVTQEASLKADARRVFNGLKACVTVHGKEGFVARGISPNYLGGVYINSSRDQVTHCVHGLWRYYHSPLCDEPTKVEIRSLMTAIANRMIKNVTPENAYDFLRADDQPCGLGICKMWEVQAHEAARLPMIYAVAWDVTGNKAYHEQYRRYVVPAVEQSARPDEKKPAYAMLQMQCSLEVLYHLETDAALKSRIREVMVHVGEIAMKRTAETETRLAQMSPQMRAMVGPDWRHVPEWKNQKGYMNPQWGEYRKVWHNIREAGESALVPMMVSQPTIPAAQRERMKTILVQSDYAHMSSCGIVYHIAMYWKARREGIL